MHHRSHIGTVAINKEVHGDFAGNITPSADLVPQRIHDDQVVRLHQPFAHHRGRTQKRAVSQANGEVAIRRGHQAGLVQQLPEADDLVAMFLIGIHAVVVMEVNFSNPPIVPQFWNSAKARTRPFCDFR